MLALSIRIKKNKESILTFFQQKDCLFFEFMSAISSSSSPGVRSSLSPYCLNGNKQEDLFWHESNVASNLWKDPYAIIDKEIVKKVNLISSYLKEFGFELEGAPADGDSFFNSFLNSYWTVHSIHSKKLDETKNRIAFLREQVSLQYKNIPSNNLNDCQIQRAEAIRKEGEWVLSSEGRLLAKALGIPIRILTVNGDTINDILTFTEKNNKDQEWKTIPDIKKPYEYVFIVDLGGHYISAKKQNQFPICSSSSSSKRKEADLEEYLPLKQAKHESRSQEIKIQVIQEIIKYPELLPLLIEELDEGTNSLIENGYTLLTYALENKAIASAKILFQKGAYIDVEDCYGYLSESIKDGNLEMVTLLLEFESNIDGKFYVEMDTALSIAAYEFCQEFQHYFSSILPQLSPASKETAKHLENQWNQLNQSAINNDQAIPLSLLFSAKIPLMHTRKCLHVINRIREKSPSSLSGKISERAYICEALFKKKGLTLAILY